MHNYSMHNIVQSECNIQALRCKLVKDTKFYLDLLVIMHKFCDCHATIPISWHKKLMETGGWALERTQGSGGRDAREMGWK